MTAFENPVRERPLDPNVAQRNASDPSSSVWVGASAGSGKTKVLTDRVLRLMLAETPPSRILCLTFTKAAAAEMAIRINRTLAQWATATDAALEDQLAALSGERPPAAIRKRARQLFAEVVDCPGGMKIQTIHAFCQSLLRRFPLEAQLAPHFEVMDDQTAATLLVEARDSVLHSGRSAPETDLGEAMARLTGELNSDSFADLMGELTRERGRIQRIFETFGGRAATVAQVRHKLRTPAGVSEFTLLRDACADTAFDEEGLRLACRALATGSAKDQERGTAIQRWLDQADRRMAGFADYSGIFLTKEGTIRKALLTKKPAEAFPAALSALEAEAERMFLVAARSRSAAVAASTDALLTLAEALVARYQERKKARALLDYDDLILTANLLLRGTEDRPAVPWVLYKLDGGLDHILIDEAQDTNPEQWQVVASIAQEFFADIGAGAGQSGAVRTVFAVGDEKQSIFSFQRADPAEFARMRGHFEEHARQADRKWAVVDLDISFRSTASVLQAVDAVFASTVASDGVASAHSPTIHHRAFRRGQAGLVELWPAVAPLESPDPPAWDPPVARETADSPSARLAAVIADSIRDWMVRGELLESRQRPIRPGDIMVLVRRRTGFVTELVRALKDRNVPVAGVDRMVLTSQLAVMDLVALAEFLLLPEDDLTLATVLKGPLLGLSEDQLFSLSWQRKGTLWRSLVAAAETDETLRPARLWLGSLLSRTDFQAPYELFAGILASPCPADSGSGRRAVLKRLGPDALDPLDEFLAICLAFEKTEPPSLQNFLAWIAASDTEIKRELEQGGGHVRIMTVHGSKGLQAPIVFLPDTMGSPTQSPAILWPDEGCDIPLYTPRRTQEDRLCTDARGRANHRRDQEYRRLLYVALTRAEDRLVICGYQGKREAPSDCWYRLAEQALSENATPHYFDFKTISTDGWAGNGYRLYQPQTDLPRPDSAATGPILERREQPAWIEQTAPVEPEPSRPLTPSRPDDDEPALRSPLGKDKEAPFKRGILVHRMLQSLPDLPPHAREAAARRFLDRPGHNLTPEQRDELALETIAVVNAPEFAHLFGPDSRAEVPVVGVVGLRALSGQIDRLVVQDGIVWIIDYKTNRPPPRKVADVPQIYVRQLGAYRSALLEIYPQHRVRCLLLWTDGPFIMELPEDLFEAGII